MARSPLLLRFSSASPSLRSQVSGGHGVCILRRASYWRSFCGFAFVLRITGFALVASGPCALHTMCSSERGGGLIGDQPSFEGSRPLFGQNADPFALFALP